MTNLDPLESLYFAALERAPADRPAYLDDACRDKPELRERVDRLLAAKQQIGEFLQPPAVTVTFSDGREPATVDFPGRDEHIGAILAGKYKLVEAIGEGGMGTVWLAHQTEPVQRKVAVKLIKAGMDSKAVIARFDAERQALAVMDHPNIAKIFDGGLHDGRPYFVMELVKGVPITDFCDARKLTPRQRLELFVPVCQAIQHAHQKGIIHRDIKPNNVLVALYDDRPVPKVIDFGLAKATGGGLTDLSINTGFGGVVGTPQYMSPEQASLNNLDIDTRSDIYSLGVLLYELLAGSPPFRTEELKRAGLMEILRIVREDQPPRPSTKLSTAEALPSLSASRGTEPGKLTGLLRNELDWIVMKALEKDRARRYETANGFAADVNRYLGGEAVLAHPPSVSYRLRKFLRKNRGPAAAAALVFLALVAGMAGTTLGLFEAKKQERLALEAQRAEAERAEGERLAKLDAQANEMLAGERLNQVEAERKKADAAKVEALAKAAEANAVVTFIEERVFAAARPKNHHGGLGAGVTLRDAVAAIVPALEAGFAEQPLVEARLRRALGVTFHYLVEYEQSRDQFERARALFTRHRGPDHPDTLQSLNHLAISYAALNRPADALKLREETLAIRRRVLPQDHQDTLHSMHDLAASYSAMDRREDAVKLFEETLAIRKRVLTPDHQHTLQSMHGLAIGYAALNRPADALKLREETLAIRMRVLTQDHPDTLESMHDLANCYAQLNRPADALKLFEETLAIHRRVLPHDHPDTLYSMHGLAASYSALNRPADALKLREEMLVIRRRVLPDHPDTLGSMSHLAHSYAALNRHADAMKLYEETLAIQKRVLPQDHTDTLGSMNELVLSYAALNRHADAIKLCEESLEIHQRVLPQDHPGTPFTMNNLATSYAALNRPADALKLREEALAIHQRVLPQDHPDTLANMVVVADSLIQLDRGVEAMPLLDEFLAKAPTIPAVNPRLIPLAFGFRGQHFQKIGDPAGCRATAEMWEKLNRTDADSLYAAARFRAVTAAVQAKTTAADAARLAKDDADRAMQWLRNAVQAGYKNVAHMKKDADLDPLRGREDFKKALAELETKFPTLKKPDPTPPSKKE